jgi:hypothetical protein
MLTDRAAISRSLFFLRFLLFLLYVSSCSLTCQVNANSIQSNQSKSELLLVFFSLSIYIYDKWDDNDKNEHIHSQIYLKNK